MQDVLAVILIIIFLLLTFIFFFFIAFSKYIKDIGENWW